MSYWESVVSRVNVPGVLLLLVGALLTYGAPKLAPRIDPKGGDRAVVPLKVAGLVLAVAGTILSLLNP